MSEEATPVLCRVCKQPVDSEEDAIYDLATGRSRYASRHMHPSRCITSLRAALDQERLVSAKLLEAAHSAADCIVHALYNEDGLCSSIGEPALAELEEVGVVSVLLSGEGKQ